MPILLVCVCGHCHTQAYQWCALFPCIVPHKRIWCVCIVRFDDGDPEFQVFNFSKEARWKSECFSSQQWRDMFPDKHLLFKPPWTFLSQMNCECDELHVLHLGLNQCLLGTALWLLVYRCLTGIPSANLLKVWDHMKAHYTQHNPPCQFSSLTLKSFVDPSRHRADYPRLRGRGMEVKYALNPILSAYKCFKRVGNAEDAATIVVLEIMSEIQAIFDEHSSGYFIPPDDAERVLGLADDLLEQYAILHNLSSGRGDLLFKVIPKNHVFWHLCFRCRFAHPRLGNTCLDEDYVRRIKKIVAMSASGLALHAIPNKVVDKFLWGKSLMYTYHESS